MMLLFSYNITLLAKIRFYWRSSPIYWRKFDFIGDFHRFIGENLILLAIFTGLLAKIQIYWRTGNSS